MDGQEMDGKELIRRIFDEIINEGRMEAVDELMAEDFVDHGPMGDMAGREAFKGLVAAWRAAVPDVECTLSHIISDGETVAWLVHASGTHTGDGLGFPATNKRFETVSANVGTIRDGMAVEHWAEQGMLPMLIQLGIFPVPGA